MRACLGAWQATSCTIPLQKTLYGANVIIFEGIMAFADKTLLEVRAGLRADVLRGMPIPAHLPASPVVLTLNLPPPSRPSHSLCPRGMWSPVPSRWCSHWVSGGEWLLSGEWVKDIGWNRPPTPAERMEMPLVGEAA